MKQKKLPDSSCFLSGKPLTPIKSIRAKCLDCCGRSAHEVKECNSPNCALYVYRFGVRPITAQKKKLIDETPSRLTVLEKIDPLQQEAEYEK